MSLYGPAPGIFVDVLNGDFAAGVGAPLTSAIAKRNLLSGALSFTTIWPVLLFDVMPEMSALGFLAFRYVSAPTMPLENEEYGPPRYSRRLIVCSKSLARTGEPSEYFSPDRSLNVYVFLSAEIVGSFSARPGTSSLAAVPVLCV